ncbi:MAG: hypothetical protein ACFFB5_10525 [Promethearchaeota archaeon]
MKCIRSTGFVLLILILFNLSHFTLNNTIEETNETQSAIKLDGTQKITSISQTNTINITMSNVVDKVAGDELVIDTGEVTFALTTEGLRVVNAITADGHSVFDAGFSLNYYRYPLWNWLTKQPWPGELAKAPFIPILGTHPIGTYTGNVEFAYSYIMEGINYDPASGIPDYYYEGLNITQIYTFYADEAYFDVKILIINPTNHSINLDGYDAGGNTIGFTTNWCGWIGPDSNDDFYAYKKRGNDPFAWYTLLYQDNRHFGDVEWLLTYDPVVGLASGFKNHNSTVSWDEWPEDFGNELRMEFQIENIPSNGSISYPLTFYAGKMNNTLIENAGFNDFMDSVGVGVTLDIDKFAYGSNDPINASYTITNFATIATTVDKIELLNESDGVIYTKQDITINPGETYNEWHTFSSSVLKVEGRSELKLKATMGIAEIPRSVTLNIVDFKGGTLYPVFLWHLHNPANYDWRGTFTSPWPLLHTQGAYRRHWEALEAHPGAHVSINIVPILLYQWYIAQNGWNDSGTWTDRATDDLKLAIQKYSELSQPDGPLEVTTTPYSHPILPLLIEAGFSEDAYRQMEMGKNFTESILSTTVRGTWLPEMSFSMDCIPILNDTGIAYTVVNKEIMLRASGMNDPLLPYRVRHETGKEIILLAEDPIGDRIAFGYNKGDMKENARRLLGDMIDIYLGKRLDFGKENKILPIALDGENWMIMGGSPNAHELLFNFYSALEEQQPRGWIKSLKLSELEKFIKNGTIEAPILSNVPSGSWADKEGFSFSNWRGEIVENDMWKYMSEARDFFYKERESLSVEEELKLWRWLMNAESSDWAFYAGRDEEATWAGGFGADLGQFIKVRHWADHITGYFEKAFVSLDWTLLWPFLSDPVFGFEKLPQLYYTTESGLKKPVFNFQTMDTVYPGYAATLELPREYGIEAGSSLAIPLAIQSRGGEAVQNVRVVISTDPGLTLLNSSTINIGTLDKITFQEDLAYGIIDMYIANWIFDVSSDVGSYQFTVTISADNIDDVVHTFTIHAAEPELSVISINDLGIKNASPGKSGILGINVKNIGIVKAVNVTVFLDLPQGLQGDNNKTINEIDIGQLTTFEWVIEVNAYTFGELKVTIEIENAEDVVISIHQIRTAIPSSDILIFNKLVGTLDITEPKIIRINLSNTLSYPVTILILINGSAIVPVNKTVQFQALETSTINFEVQGLIGGEKIVKIICYFHDSVIKEFTSDIFINDEVPPSIKDARWSPEEPEATDRITFTVTVIDPSGIQIVVLKYKTDLTKDWTSKSMIKTGENDWSAIIGPFQDAETLYLKIEATDSLGNVQTKELQIEFKIEIETSTTTTSSMTTTSSEGRAPGFLALEVTLSLFLLLLLVKIIRKRSKFI